MKVILREDESGVSEVIGTILILAMTVVLFSTIIIWVTNIPTPTAQSRLDMESTMNPVIVGGVEVGVNITVRHLGGDRLDPVFFSIRGRHARFDCDWSSDVCSSDLTPATIFSERRGPAATAAAPASRVSAGMMPFARAASTAASLAATVSVELITGLRVSHSQR